MLYIAIFLSSILLIAVNIAVYAEKKPVLRVSIFGLFASLGSVCLMAFFPPFALQAFFLCLVSAYWVWSGRGPSRFHVLSIAATILAYVITMLLAAKDHQNYNALREQFPFQSLEERLPLVSPSSSQTPAKQPDLLNLSEKAISEKFSPMHEHQLQQLHSNTVNVFVNKAGFGVGRMGMTQQLDSDTFKNFLRKEPAPYQPSYLSENTSKKPFNGELKTEDVFNMHVQGIADFVNPIGFGYVKDRQHVAGFQSHGFSKVPDSKNDWEVSRLELVSLLMHKDPGVYVSERLPKMDELKGVSMRALDAFEKEGLDALRNGDDLHVKGGHMLGAIRSTSQCIRCHGGERGQLLGAFSYTFR